MNDQENNTQPDKQQPILNRDPLFFWLIISMFILYYASHSIQQKQIETLSYSEFINSLESNQLKAVELKGHSLKGQYKNTETQAFDFQTQLPEFNDEQLLPLMKHHGVKVHVKPEKTPVWLQLIIGFLPWLLIIAFFVYSSRIMQSRMGGKGGLFNFSRSKARRYLPSENSPHYDDVAGVEGAKQDLSEIIDYLKHPEAFQKLGAKIPKGILLMGAPGTGKTLLAKATAAEANVPFYSISGSEFIELYVGVGASRVRDMFSQARKESPALIFIDEIDSVGRVRGTGMGGGNDEREQTLNQILAEMDGFEPEEVIVVLAATNRPDVLDPALLRPGRFDRKVVLELPQKQARIDIFRVHTRHTPLAQDVDFEQLAAMTIGFSGADIENLVNEAALRAARKKHNEINAEDFQKARDKVLMGGERKDLMTDNERERIACHEAGHSIVALFARHSDPLKKVSIIPRGHALGLTEQQPNEDRHNINEDYLRDRLSILLAGRCAEKLTFNNYSSGAADDLKKATQLARRMVINWGMSKNLGPIGYSEGEEHPFLGKEITQAREYSEATAKRIDEEISLLLITAEQQAENLLSKHQPQHQLLIKALLEQETLEYSEITRLLQLDSEDKHGQ